MVRALNLINYYTEIVVPIGYQAVEFEGAPQPINAIGLLALEHETHYETVAQFERKRSQDEISTNYLTGVSLVVLTLGLCLLSPDVRDLFEETSTIKYAIAIPGSNYYSVLERIGRAVLAIFCIIFSLGYVLTNDYDRYIIWEMFTDDERIVKEYTEKKYVKAFIAFGDADLLQKKIEKIPAEADWSESENWWAYRNVSSSISTTEKLKESEDFEAKQLEIVKNLCNLHQLIRKSVKRPHYSILCALSCFSKDRELFKFYLPFISLLAEDCKALDWKDWNVKDFADSNFYITIKDLMVHEVTPYAMQLFKLQFNQEGSFLLPEITSRILLQFIRANDLFKILKYQK